MPLVLHSEAPCKTHPLAMPLFFPEDECLEKMLDLPVCLNFPAYEAGTILCGRFPKLLVLSLSPVWLFPVVALQVLGITGDLSLSCPQPPPFCCVARNA